MEREEKGGGEAAVDGENDDAETWEKEIKPEPGVLGCDFFDIMTTYVIVEYLLFSFFSHRNQILPKVAHQLHVSLNLQNERKHVDLHEHTYRHTRLVT